LADEEGLLNTDSSQGRAALRISAEAVAAIQKA